MNICSRTRHSLLLVCCFYAMSAFAADTVTGKVHNRTTNQPSAGDEVVLLRLGNGMEEEARTRTDAQGAFSFHAAASDAQHIVRVLHQGVNYDQTVKGTAPLDIPVFDAVPRIPGLSGNLGIARVESDGKMLKITEMYAINNASAPPVTQLGPRNFEISMPPKATLDSVMAKRAAGVWVNVAPSAVNGEEGHYSLDFPLRPGDTLFKFAYHLPFAGRATLHLKLSYPIKSFAVAHPPSMSFKAERPQTFASPGLVQGLQLEQAIRQPVVVEVPAFEIAGIGTAPPSATEAQAPRSPVQPAATSAEHPSAPPAVAAEAAPAASSKDVWAVGCAVMAVLAAALFAVWQRRKSAGSPSAAGGAVPVFLIDALKEELFQLETERLHGAISAEQYASTKQALNLSIQRALAKGKS